MASLKIVHYLNQFFGGLGGEEKAEAGLKIQEGCIGPGMAIQKTFGEAGKVVATVICGDNTFAENIESASREVCEMIRPYQPDLLIAGPAFNAGRYGIACGAVCHAVMRGLGIPAVTGMHAENPGVDLYCQEVYILSTQDSARGMNEAVSKIVKLARKLVAKEKIGRPAEEGYFPRGVLVNELSDRSGAERVVSLLLKKLSGEPYQSEVPRPMYDRVPPAPRIQDLSRAKIALVTDGGLVPKGNPDKIEARTATRFGRYPIAGMDSLHADGYEVSHVGYDSIFVRQDPNRLVPLDVMREFQKEGRIGELHDLFYSTAGVANVVETMAGLGKKIAEELKAAGVSGVILTST